MRVDLWTLERVDRLRKLWAAGWSGAAIAGELGAGLTRSAVIGKARRMDLASRDITYCKSRAALSRPKRTWETGRYRSRRPTRSGFCPADVPRFHPAATCQYPLWPEVACVGTYCGAEPIPGYPYCRDHCVMCYH